jgi:hypothetical protein
MDRIAGQLNAIARHLGFRRLDAFGQMRSNFSPDLPAFTPSCLRIDNGDYQQEPAPLLS